MADNDNTETSNQVVTRILTLKDQVLKWAAPKQHSDTDPDKYGQGTNSEYGHVKVSNTLSQDDDNPVKGSAIYSYINGVKQGLEKYKIITSENVFVDADSSDGKSNIPTTKAVLKKINEMLSDFQPFNVLTEITSETKHEDDTNHRKNIPTAKAVWDALSSYKDLLVGVSYKMPQSYKKGINTLTTAGYYIMDHDKTKPKSFSYGGETIYYTNALVTVKKQSNRVIQHVCATTKVTSSKNASNYNYKINGSEYTRHGSYNSNGETTWKPWHVAHKPYSKTSRVKKPGQGVDDNSVVVYENTAGFIIQWKQTNSNQKRYPVYASLYQYVDVCEFSPALPITGPYVFGNLIGRMDIKITPTKMQIRSNVAPGGRIIEMEETYFVPRNQ